MILGRENTTKATYSGRFDARGYNRKPPGHFKNIVLPNASMRKKSRRKAIKEIPDSQITEESSGRLERSTHSAGTTVAASTDEIFLTELSER